MWLCTYSFKRWHITKFKAIMNPGPQTLQNPNTTCLNWIILKRQKHHSSRLVSADKLEDYEDVTSMLSHKAQSGKWHKHDRVFRSSSAQPRLLPCRNLSSLRQSVSQRCISQPLQLPSCCCCLIDMCACISLSARCNCQTCPEWMKKNK